MIQDFAGVFVGRQAVRVRAVPIRENAEGKKAIGMVLTGAVLAVMVASLVFCLLIRSARNELTGQATVRAEMEKVQKGLLAQRNTLLDQNTLVRSAGKLGLYVPESKQVRHL